MNTNKVKNNIKKRFNYCKAIADDIIKYNATDDIIAYAKEWAEIESPMTEETDSAWVRINWSDIYIFIYMDEDAWFDDGVVKFTGEASYQLDPFSEYGGELIDADTVDEFMEELKNLNLKEDELVRNNYNGDFGEDDIYNAVPNNMYVPYCEAF